MPLISKKEAERRHYAHKNIQTVLFPKSLFNKRQAKRWLQENNYKRADDYRSTLNFHRFMQHNPVIGADYYTIILDNGVHVVIQNY